MSKDRKKDEKRGFFEYLAVRADADGDSIAGDVYIEMRGKNSLLVKGCKRILGYSPEAVELEIKKDKLRVKGKRLVCTSFHSGSVSVEGVIDSLAFCTEEEE